MTQMRTRALSATAKALASLAVTFHSLSNVPLGKTRSLKGDAIAEITDVFVAWYREDGTLAGSSYHPGEQLQISDIPRKESTTEQTTQRADFECRIPYGRYRIYAAVNTGDLSTDPRYASQIAREADFRQITLTWDTDTKNNDQMSGYFTEGEPTPSAVRGEAPVITINSAKPALHAWGSPPRIESHHIVRHDEPLRKHLHPHQIGADSQHPPHLPRCSTPTMKPGSRTPTKTFGSTAIRSNTERAATSTCGRA